MDRMVMSSKVPINSEIQGLETLSMATKENDWLSSQQSRTYTSKDVFSFKVVFLGGDRLFWPTPAGCVCNCGCQVQARGALKELTSEGLWETP